MLKKSAWISFFSLVIVAQGIAQNISEGVRTDRRTKETSPVYYSYSHKNIQNIFYSNYAIFLNPEADTAYLVDFTFDTYSDSIRIVQKDILLGQEQARSMKFHALPYKDKPSEAKPYYCIKNYSLHDTTLTLTDDSLDILFTIADTASPKINLNQIISPDGNYHFSLIKLRNVYLTPHLIHAKDYWEWNRKEIERQITETAQLAALQTATQVEKERIIKDRDSLILKFSEIKQILNLSQEEADEIHMRIFRLKMDTICLDYLGRSCNYNIDEQVIFNIISPYNHQPSAEITTTVVPDTIKIHWFNSRIDSIANQIRRFAFENKKVAITQEDPVQILQDLHKARSRDLQHDMAELSLSFDSAFAPVFEELRNDTELMDYFNKKVEITTLYDYSFSYRSMTKPQKWFYWKGELRDENDSLIRRQDNLDSFNKKLPQAKNGKYSVILNTAMLKDSLFGPDLFHAERKYKYVTHIGFNIGTFMAKGDLVEGQDTHDGRLLYWNAFLIYHHFGLFGGKGLEENSLIRNYYEGGVYLAPGNIFYFKLGLGKYTGEDFSNKLMPLVGGSLIFPVFQMEGGYNFALKMPYVMIGLNIPLNF